MTVSTIAICFAESGCSARFNRPSSAATADRAAIADREDSAVLQLSGHDFGTRAIGSLTSSTVTVTHSGSGSATLESLSLSSPDFTLLSSSCSAGLLLSSGAQCSATLQFFPKSAGAKSVSATLAYTDSVGAHSDSQNMLGNASGAFSTESLFVSAAQQQEMLCADANPSYEHNQAFSVSIWMKRENIAPPWPTAISRYDPAQDWRGWEIVPFQAGASVVLSNGWYTGNKIEVTSTTPLPDGTWTHLAFTYDGSGVAAGVRIFVNGSETGKTILDDDLGGLTMAHTAPLRLGSNATPNELFSGNLDEVSLWNVLLTPAEITELYNTGLPFDLRGHSRASGLAHWYRLGESLTGLTVMDEIGSVNCVFGGSGTSAANFTGDTPN